MPCGHTIRHWLRFCFIDLFGRTVMGPDNRLSLVIFILLNICRWINIFRSEGRQVPISRQVACIFYDSTVISPLYLLASMGSMGTRHWLVSTIQSVTCYAMCSSCYIHVNSEGIYNIQEICKVCVLLSFVVVRYQLISLISVTYTSLALGQSWASYQIRKIAGCACTGNAGNVFLATDFKGNR